MCQGKSPQTKPVPIFSPCDNFAVYRMKEDPEEMQECKGEPLVFLILITTPLLLKWEVKLKSSPPPGKEKFQNHKNAGSCLIHWPTISVFWQQLSRVPGRGHCQPCLGMLLIKPRTFCMSLSWSFHTTKMHWVCGRADQLSSVIPSFLE